MNGELAQIVALVAHGNMFLNDPPIERPESLLSNSTFQFVQSVHFNRYASRDDKEGAPVAQSVGDWLKALRAGGVRQLRYVAYRWGRPDMPERVADSFSGGVSRSIQTPTNGGFECWYPLWRHADRPEKPWDVEYRALTFPYDSAQVPPMATCRQALQRSLHAAQTFAHRRDVNQAGWADVFGQALQLLDSPDPTPPYHTDLLPVHGYGLDARQIMSACIRAWVFGGMGSWNDMTFGNAAVQREYNAVSDDLYDSIKLAVVGVANSFAVPSQYLGKV
jgi:hypothetical protein